MRSLSPVHSSQFVLYFTLFDKMHHKSLISVSVKENNGCTIIWAAEIQTVEARDTRILTFQTESKLRIFYRTAQSSRL